MATETHSSAIDRAPALKAPASRARPFVVNRMPGFGTMALLMFDFAVSGQLESAAVVGVIVAILCVTVTVASLRIGRGVGIRG